MVKESSMILEHTRELHSDPLSLGSERMQRGYSKFGSQTGENPDALETSDIWVWHLEVSWLTTEFILVHLLNFADKEKLLQESLKKHIIYTGWGDLVLPAFFPTAMLNARWAMFIVLRGKNVNKNTVPI